MKSKNMKTELTNFNMVTKILLIVLVVAVSYYIIFLALRPFFAPTSMMDMMNQTIVGRTDTIISFIIALVIGIIISFYIFKDKSKEIDEVSILRKALSDDENKILSEIKKAGKITQDSLRFRLGWSKAKVSTILTNLDKKGIVQRQRTGKTYNIHLQNAK